MFGTILVTTGIELLWTTLDFYLRNPVTEPLELKNKIRGSLLKTPPILLKRAKNKNADLIQREEAILGEINQYAFDFIFSYAQIDSPETLILNTWYRQTGSGKLFP